MARTLLGALIILAVSSCGVGCAPASPADRWSGLRLNELQVIGTHNSYKLAIQPELMDGMALVDRGTRGLDYQHLTVTDQLNLGVRNLEFDVYWDPEGGRYADPLGNRMLRAMGVEPWPVNAEALAEPGFKVIHDADFDFRTHHVRLSDTLDELARWTDLHPSHVPVVVTMNMKQGRADVPGAVDPARFDAEAFARLNREITGALGVRVLLPDDVRDGAVSLRARIEADGWPEVDSVRGRHLFVLDHGGETMRTYLGVFPNLEGAAFFTVSDPGEPTSGVLIINDPQRDGDRIRDLVRAGYIVRTRADAGTREARAEDRSRFEAAKASGAQVITTDYPIPDRKMSDRYVVRFDDGGFVRVNPVTRAGEIERASP